MACSLLTELSPYSRYMTVMPAEHPRWHRPTKQVTHQLPAHLLEKRFLCWAENSENRSKQLSLGFREPWCTILYFKNRHYWLEYLSYDLYVQNKVFQICLTHHFTFYLIYRLNILNVLLCISSIYFYVSVTKWMVFILNSKYIRGFLSSQACCLFVS